jgi:quercetin dioxygenase-like cupin family protein
MSLTIEHAEDLPRRPGAPAHFTGTTWSQLVASAPDGSVNVYRVTFERGARTFWHVHSGEQVLYFLEGRGRVQVRGEPPVDAVAGDVVRIPPQTEHWHGAHLDEAQRMRHLAITFGTVTWLEPVAEEEYRAS